MTPPYGIFVTMTDANEARRIAREAKALVDGMRSRTAPPDEAHTMIPATYMVASRPGGWMWEDLFNLASSDGAGR